MADKDIFSSFKTPSLFQKKSVFQPFITQDINKRVELLSHLVENSNKDVVVLGLKGVGKSTLISILVKQKKEYWFNCIINATNHISYENILDKINQAKNKSFYYKLAEHNVLVIDDASSLDAGLINSILTQNIAIRNFKVIFLFTHEEYEKKLFIDNLLNNCYLIELEPFTKRQCAEFINFLAPQSNFNFLELNDNKLDEIYTETHGIPGNILQLFPTMQDIKNNDNALNILLIAIIMLVILALLTQSLSDPSVKFNQISLQYVLDFII